MSQIDLNQYLGMLRLHCDDCEEQRPTFVKFYDVQVTKTAGNDTMIDCEAKGRRHCVVCDSTRVGMRYLKISLTIDNKTMQIKDEAGET